MNNLNLIFTIHKQNGECNSDALYKIIEFINPDIIFEELSHTNYDKVYNSKTLITLESTAIKKYLKNKNIKHIPVDTYDFNDNHYDNIEFMLGKLINNFELQESYELRELIEEHSSLINSNGFAFLNSDHNNKVFEKMDILKEKLLKIINDEELYKIAQLQKDVIEKRENEILNNVYNYGKKHIFKQAFLFIGSGHRKAFMEKIRKCNKQEEHKINWVFHNA